MNDGCAILFFDIGTHIIPMPYHIKKMINFLTAQYNSNLRVISDVQLNQF